MENLTNSLHQYEEIYGMLGNNFPLLELEANKRNQRSLKVSDFFKENMPMGVYDDTHPTNQKGYGFMLLHLNL